MKKSKHLVKPFRVEHGKDFRLKDHDPAQTAGLHSKPKRRSCSRKGSQSSPICRTNSMRRTTTPYFW